MPRIADLPGIAALLGRLVYGHMTNPRRALTLEDRINSVPTSKAPSQAPIQIHWNEHLIPFIQAENEPDLAVGLGITHAHLRLGQIEFLKYVSQGRLSEILGPAANGIDHTLRVLDLGKASKATYEAMPESTKVWMKSYAAGINYVIESVEGDRSKWPEEFRILNVRPTRWSIEDLLTLARLNCADFTWGLWPKLLPLRGRPDWKAIWAYLMNFGGGPPVPPEGTLAADDALAWLSGLFGKPGGSNAVAVQGHRTASGNALLSGDPHLPMVLPSFWILGGLHCPTFKTVGYMLPGLPAVMVGRTPEIAWGGTSMHAASSDLFDVSSLGDEHFSRRTEVIKTRWGRDRKVVVTESSCGPVLTDAPLFSGKKMLDGGARLAFRWVGHQVSDEITAMLGVARASSFEQFQNSLRNFAVAGQNIVYADTKGNVGQVMAAKLPARPAQRPDDLVGTPESHIAWETMVDTTGLPSRYNPEEGVVVSANNRPETDSAVLVSCFFSPDDRVERLRSVLGGMTTVDGTGLRSLMTDVKSDSGLRVRNTILPLIEDNKSPVVGKLAAWDGYYTPGSDGALAFEFFLYHFAVALHGKADIDVLTVNWDPRCLLEADLQHVPRAVLKASAAAALANVEADLNKHGTWGEVHRIRYNHPLGGLPVIGKRWKFGEDPAAGANETLMKAAHGFATGKQYVGMSSTARYFFDMGDLNESLFVMLGGQDGVAGSPAFTDQIAIWRREDMLQIPLELDAVRKRYTTTTTIEP